MATIEKEHLAGATGVKLATITDELIEYGILV